MGLLGHASVPSSMASSKLLINHVCMHRGVSELTPPGLSLAQSSPRPLQGPLQSSAINTRPPPPPPCWGGLSRSTRSRIQTLTYISLFAQIFEEVLGGGCLRGARFTDQNDGLFNLNHLLQHPGGAGRIHRVN